MTQATEQNRRYTLDEYFEIEENTEYRNEYYKGYIYAMAGGTPNHALIINNVSTTLKNLLKGSGCKTYSSELKLYIEAEDLVTYPDKMVICGPLKMVEKRNDAVTNPITIVEVLSKSTQNYDKIGKFEMYQKLESLQEYILVDQYRILVHYYHRTGPDEWKLHTYRQLEDVLELETLKIKVPLAEIYDEVEFKPESLHRIAGFYRPRKRK